MRIRNIVEVEANTIYEVVITTASGKNETNIAPMGIIFSDEEHFLLRPFMNTTTYRNLREHGEGVVNITRNPRHFVLAALPELRERLILDNSRKVKAMRLKDAEAYLEFKVEGMDEHEERAEVFCRIIDAYRGDDVIQPYTRAAYALIEAVISATRVKVFLGREQRLIELLDEIERCRKTVIRVSPSGRFRHLLDTLLREVRRMVGYVSST